MKKRDLKSGMFVRLANNSLVVVIGDVLLSSKGNTVNLCWYNEDLLSMKGSRLDMVAVYPVIGEGGFERCNWVYDMVKSPPIWERKCINGFQLVWAWDDDQVAVRKIGVYDGINGCIFGDFGEVEPSCMYDNYQPLEEGEILPWMERMVEVCRENNPVEGI